MKGYRIDTHVHTAEVSPCGKIPAEEVVKLYIEQNYDAIIITDHYHDEYFDSLDTDKWEEKVDSYLSGYRTAVKYGKEAGLNILLGIELRFAGHPNDFLVYGLDEDFLYNNPELYKLTPEEFTELRKGTGIVMFQAHPFRKKMEVEKNEYLDGIEVINGNPRHDSDNNTAYRHALKNNLRMLSGSDFHQYTDIARGGLVLTEKITTSKDFADYIMNHSDIKLIGQSLLSA